MVGVRWRLKTAARIIRSALGIQRKRRDKTHFFLLSKWERELDAALSKNQPVDILSEHPRPQFKRDCYFVLNGWWDFEIVALSSHRTALKEWRNAKPPSHYSQRIVVPFSPESPLSHIEQTIKPSEVMWYRRAITVPNITASERLILHFEAVDWACIVFCDGSVVGSHEGAYNSFCFDVTEHARRAMTGIMTIVVCAYDPSEYGSQLRGKQRIERRGIWYTAQSGIWQTVWMEVVPDTRVDDLVLDTANIDGRLSCKIACVFGDGIQDQMLGLEIFERGALVASAREIVHRETNASRNTLVSKDASGEDSVATTLAELEMKVDSVKLWTPEAPFLYDVLITFGCDRIHSYCGFRTCEVKRDCFGVSRFFLNGEPYFIKGVLDQGYWPGGLMTAPSLAAISHDINRAKELGFNAVRKHVKIETELWYAECDRIGLLIWQDMPSGGNGWNEWEVTTKPSLFESRRCIDDTSPRSWVKLSSSDSAYKREWLHTLELMTHSLMNHPCIITWSLFNEGWGQFDSESAVDFLRTIDSSRPIDAASGWFDQGAGDYVSIHDYSSDVSVKHADRDGFGSRALVLTECGGFSYVLKGHVYSRYTFGYKYLNSIDDWRVELASFATALVQGEQKGIAGFFYTQLYDVEEETNGIDSYDRVSKLALSESFANSN